MAASPLDPELAVAFSTVALSLSTREELPESRRLFSLDGDPEILLITFPALSHREETIQGPSGVIILSIFEKRTDDIITRTKPCFYHIHSGGMIMGNRFVGAGLVLEWAVRFDAVCVLVEYRLAPEHPAPAAIQDCYAGLEWVDKNAKSLGIDPKCIVVVGQSGGGGLAAGTVLLARDQSGPAVKGQLLICPMLDDRNSLASSIQCDRQPWPRAYNEMAWNYVFEGQEEENRDSYSAPAHIIDLGNLPPTYIDVGSGEIFRDECVAFASRLLQSGNMTELHVWPGAFHCFDAYVPAALVSQSARRSRVEWVARVLHLY